MTESAPSTAPAQRPGWLVPAVQSLVIVCLFAGVGCLAGWVWWELWSPPPTGIAINGLWYPQPATEGLKAEFAGTGWYVVVALLSGLALGLASGLLLDRDEILTLAAVAVGSVLAAWLMFRVGVSLSPPDPALVAADAADRTEIPGRLFLAGEVDLPGDRLDGQVRSPMLALPVGAMAGLVVALFGITKPRQNRD